VIVPATISVEMNIDGVGDVFVWGSNDNGVLGLITNARQRKRPFPVALLDSTIDSGYHRLLPKCSQIATKGLHSVAVTPDGVLHTWGVGDEGQLARPISPDHEEDHPGRPAPVTMPKGAGPVVRVAASDGASFAVDENGNVYAAGVFKDDSELGLVPANPGARVWQMTPLSLPKSNTRVTEISAGNAHCVMLAEVGAASGKQTTRHEVYTVGTGGRGQLGRIGERVGARGGADTKTQLTPCLVRMPRGAGAPVAVFAGGWHTFVLTETDQVYGFGLNNWGQLGLPVSHGPCVYKPTLIAALSGNGIVQLACGEHHTLALTKEGYVLSFGRYVYGRLGRVAGVELHQGDAACPTPMQVMIGNNSGTKIVTVAAGVAQSAAVDENGKLFVWGSGDGYMLGRGNDEDDAETPVAVLSTDAYTHWDPETMKVTQVAMGGMHCVALAKPGY
jgi:regulator of chromosome condensation